MEFPVFNDFRLFQVSALPYQDLLPVWGLVT